MKTKKKSALGKAVNCLLAVVLACGLLPAGAWGVGDASAKDDALEPLDITSGSAGPNATWTYDSETEVLRIEGTGAMKDFSYSGSRPSAYSTASEIYISEGITSVGYYSFYQNTNLKTIHIPSSVKSVSNYAFQGCTAIENLCIGDISSYLAITYADGYNVLSYTQRPVSLYVQDELATNLVIPEGAIIASDGALRNCASLRKIVFPSTATSVASVIPGCTQLKTVGPIGSGKDIEFGWTRNIPERAFYYMNWLTDVEIPMTIESIGSGALSGVSAIRGYGSAGDTASYVYYSDGAILFTGSGIAKGQFYGSSGYAFTYADALVFSPSITEIDCDFRLPLLETAEIPEGVQRLGNYVFAGCERLKAISLPKSLTFIDHTCFNMCGQLQTVNYAGTKTDRAALIIDCNSNSPLLAAQWNYAHEHQLVTSEIKPATCTDGGYTELRCLTCDHREIIDQVDPLGHSVKDVPAVAPTCEEDGVTAGQYCDRCGLTLSGCEAESALGHDWGEWTVIREASCGAEGLEQRACANDASHVETRATEAADHAWLAPVILFTEDGSAATAIWTCENNVGHVVIAPCAITSTVVPATCETPEVTAITAQAEKEGMPTGEAVKAMETSPALGHAWSGWAIAAEATCEADGLRTRTCGNDEAHIQSEAIPALGHVWGKPAIVLSDDLSETTATWICGRDTSHTHTATCSTEKKVTTAATCFKNGEAIFAMASDPDGETLFALDATTEVLPAIGHHFEGRICTDCGTQLGDVNGNGAVNIVDAQIAYDMATKGFCMGEEFYKAYRGAANVSEPNEDTLDAVDAYRIQYIIHYGWDAIA